MRGPVAGSAAGRPARRDAHARVDIVHIDGGPGDHTEASGIEAGRLLPAERDAGRALPTAVLANNDRCATGLMPALACGGLDIPVT